MQPLRTICRAILRTELSNRKIAAQMDVSATTVSRYRTRLGELGLSWNQVDVLDDLALDRALNVGRHAQKRSFVEPDWAQVHAEHERPGVTISLLHEEYALGVDSDSAMSETEFRRRYRRYARTRGLVMRQVRHPGYELFLDFSGKRPSIVDRKTGITRPVELFVAVMGNGCKTFVHAIESQSLPDWIECNVRCLDYFGGVPMYLVPDNLKAAVTQSRRKGAAIINSTYAELAAHYDTTVMPARPYKPKDKAPVEVAVLIAQRWILARIRNQRFFSIEELNQALRLLNERLNAKPMRSRGGKSRNELFEELDAPMLRSLPEFPYEYADWKIGVTVGQDYHVAWQDHYYSIHHVHIGHKVDIRATKTAISIFHRGKRQATHVRDDSPGEFSTLMEHMPPAHQGYARDSLNAIQIWVDQQGGAIQRFFALHLERHGSSRSLQAGRGLRTLERSFGLQRLQAACTRAIGIHAISTRSVKFMLGRGIEATPPPTHVSEESRPDHQNVRGAHYYQTHEETPQ